MTTRKYDVADARPLAVQGLPYAVICQRLGWNARNATAAQRQLRTEGVLVGFHSNEYVTGEVCGAKQRHKPSGDALPVTAPAGDGGGRSAPLPKTDTFDEVKGTRDGVRYADRAPKSLDELMDLFGVDRTVWSVVTYTVKSWEMGYKDAQDTGQALPLYSISAKFQRSAAAVLAKSAIAEMIEEARHHAPVYAPLLPRLPGQGNYGVVSCYDLHLGKLAYGKETGHGNYDSAIAAALFNTAVDDLLAKMQGFGLERICFPVGNDLLNTESGSLATTANTPQNVDGRPKKTFRQAWKMLVEGIDRMRLVAPVDVVIVPGNHAEFSEFAIGEVLEAWYNHCPDVTVDNSPALRKYYAFGKCLLCFTHGDRESHSRLPGIVAAEQPDLWAQATAGREINIGHYHKVALNEYPGIRLRTLPSLCAPDSWHAQAGYVESRRSAEAYVWNVEEGLIGSAVYNAS